MDLFVNRQPIGKSDQLALGLKAGAHSALKQLSKFYVNLAGRKNTKLPGSG